MIEYFPQWTKSSCKNNTEK